MNTKPKKSCRFAFTLAETLITLGVIGVIAALTMPTLLTNIQERITKEKVRTVKYKLTQATDKMKALDKIGSYETTEKFLDELKKHMTIAKICDNTHLTECWPTSTINVTNSTKNVSDIKTGQDLMSLALGTSATTTMGIVTGDGTPMILVYSPVCTALDPAKSYTWSVVDGKPETNATTNCVSAIFDINGTKGPNKIGTDIRTLNSIFGATYLSDYEPADKKLCNEMKKKYGFSSCGPAAESGQDYWVGAIYACKKLGLHMVSASTMANIANARFGTTQIGPNTAYVSKDATEIQNYPGGCETWLREQWGMTGMSNIICNGRSEDTNSSVKDISLSWTSSGFVNQSLATIRETTSKRSLYFWANRDSNYSVLCVGD